MRLMLYARLRLLPKRLTLCYFHFLTLCWILCHIFKNFSLILEVFAKRFWNKILVFWVAFLLHSKRFRGLLGLIQDSKKVGTNSSEMFHFVRISHSASFYKKFKVHKVRATCNSHLQTTKLIDQRCWVVLLIDIRWRTH